MKERVRWIWWRDMFELCRVMGLIGLADEYDQLHHMSGTSSETPIFEVEGSQEDLAGCWKALWKKPVMEKYSSY